MTYTIAVWWAWVPWGLAGVLAVGLFFSVRAGMRWMKVQDLTMKRMRELEAGMTRANENRFKAESDAREATAALEECGRKLEAEKHKVELLGKLCNTVAEQGPKRDKFGHFAPKQKKIGKVKKPRAKPNRKD
jgi:hypothetical protein